MTQNVRVEEFIIGPCRAAISYAAGAIADLSTAGDGSKCERTEANLEHAIVALGRALCEAKAARREVRRFIRKRK